MKKALAILLALVLICSLGISAFAASDTVSGTLKDGTAVTKPVGEILLSAAEAVAKNDALAAFFEKANGYSSTLSTGAVDFGGAFADVVESTVLVPLSVSGAKAGDALLVTLSDGSVSSYTCEESGVVVAAFPKDAACLGYYVSSVTADWGDTSWPAYPTVLYEEIEDWTFNGVPQHTVMRYVQYGPGVYAYEYVRTNEWDGWDEGYTYKRIGTAIEYDDDGDLYLPWANTTSEYERDYCYGDGSYQETVGERNAEGEWVENSGHYDPNGNYLSPGVDEEWV